MDKKLVSIFSLLIFSCALFAQKPKFGFRIRAITAGVTLSSLHDTAALHSAIDFLLKAKQKFIERGYEVQTLRISTQNLFEYIPPFSYDDALPFLKRFDRIVEENNVILAIGQVLAPDQYQPGIGDWAGKLTQMTKNISFSLSISSHERGIHFNSIKAASEILSKISKLNGGETCFRFTASANCPSNIPFFPAAFHEGKNSFGIGLESAGLVTKAFRQDSDPATARQTLKSVFEGSLLPVQTIAKEISNNLNWPCDGIDDSPAPGLDASIGEAIETYSKQPFGSSATLSACALITDVLKSLDVKKCGYSGLMLPIIEDKVLAARAKEKHFTMQELLLYSAVSGTGLDVVPLPGNTSRQTVENIMADVASLSLKYTAKALSVRLFLIPGKNAGDLVEFKNPALTSTTVMEP